MCRTTTDVFIIQTKCVRDWSHKNLFRDNIRTCAYQGVRNVHFSENLACLVFMKHPIWDSPFYLITDEFWKRSLVGILHKTCSVFPGKDIFIALKKLIKRTIPVTRNMWSLICENSGVFSALKVQLFRQVKYTLH